MALLVFTSTWTNLSQDAGSALTEGGDLDQFLKSFRRAASVASEAVPEVATLDPTDRLETSLEFYEEKSASNPDLDDPTGSLAIEVAVRIDSDIAYGYRQEGSPVQRFIQAVVDAFTAEFFALPGNGQDLLGKLGVTEVPTLGVRLRMQAPR